MPSAMVNENEVELSNILEEIETYKWILESYAPNETANIEDTKRTIRELEAKVRQLCGEPSPVPETAPPLTSPPRSMAETPRLASQVPQMTPSPHQTRTIPLPQTSGHWPSSAPSPFGNPPIPASGQNGWSFANIPSRSSAVDSPRKRDRQDSFETSTPSQSVKRTAVNPALSRVDAIKKELAMQLENNVKIHADMRHPDAVRRTAEFEDKSEAEVLDEIDAEEEESRRTIELKYQMEIDEAYARSLQAQYLVPGHDPESELPLQNTLRRSALPQPQQSYRSSSQPYSSTSLRSDAFHRGMSPVADSDDGFDSSDSLEEITPDAWRSRFGAPTMPGGYPPKSEATISPSSFALATDTRPVEGRSRDAPETSMDDPARTAHPEMKVFDAIREQQDMDEDAIDFEMYKEEDFPTDIKTLLTGIKDINKATKADTDAGPSALKVTLMKHQNIGLAWLKAKEDSTHKGGILADDMGLGKTIQAIALMVARPSTDPERHPTLIIAPKALMEQWRLEIGRHVKPGFHQLKVLIYHGATRNTPWKEIAQHDVVITTFGTLTANHKMYLQADELERQGRDVSIVAATREKATFFTPKSLFHRVIIDEAQNIKNPASKGNQACCALDSQFRWCLTGTPMMNRLEDFQALLSFLRIRPYCVRQKFKQDFVRPLKSGYGEENVMVQLRILVKSVCLRRTKKTKIDGQPILQLPPKVIEKVHVVFNETERELYDELSSSTQRTVTRLLKSGTLGRNYSHVLVLLLRLRQACDHPHLITGGNSGPLAPAVEGVDLIANAKLLAPPVVERIKKILIAPGTNNGDDGDDGSCPVCFDAVENSVIYISCGHSVCSECFAKITDPAQLARVSDSEFAKCQNCRSEVDPLKITDAVSFKKVYDPALAESPDKPAETSTETGSASTTASETDTDSDLDDSETGTLAERKSKHKTLGELRSSGLRNKAEKKKYLQRLEKNWVSSAKIDKTMEILQANEDRGQGEKTIVFSQFTALLDLLEVPIMRRGLGYMRFDGSMNVNERNISVATFTDNPDCRIMLVSLKAGNAGLNLIAASHVIIFDPFWNPYVEDQAIDRAHRIGQSKDVFVHRLLIPDTVEDRIIALQDKKRDLISGALDEGGTLNVSRLDTRELAYLFGVRQ
ncbi:hypothetical protein N7468_009654 [Penicillium chermesinum]|uniref:Uncharacterized protein n=1 Tax=Penicillium chermesinum TaxID=63820 RepID=A0A9W9NI76_9EURO|nr:uncharacterized protein N7468_009654 [Penicillium chermesinum]KAJ5220450.1 hypothetical protein N7468_009654 [Penicillium chermesinum]